MRAYNNAIVEQNFFHSMKKGWKEFREAKNRIDRALYRQDCFNYYYNVFYNGSLPKNSNEMLVYKTAKFLLTVAYRGLAKKRSSDSASHVDYMRRLTIKKKPTGQLKPGEDVVIISPRDIKVDATKKGQ